MSDKLQTYRDPSMYVALTTGGDDNRQTGFPATKSDFVLYPVVYPAIDGETQFEEGGGGVGRADSVAAYMGTAGGKVTVMTPNASYEDLLWHQHATITGPTIPTGGVFTLDDTTHNPAFPLVHIRTDGSDLKTEMLNGLVSKWTVEADAPKNRLKSTLDIVGDFPTDESSALTPPGSRTLDTSINLSHTTAQFDTGGSNVVEAAALKGFKVEFDNQVDNTDGVARKVHHAGTIKVMVTLVVKLSDKTKAEVEHMYTGADNRFVRITIPNAASSPTEKWQFSAYGAWLVGTPVKDGNYWNLPMVCRAVYNSTAGYSWQIAQTTAATSIPVLS